MSHLAEARHKQVGEAKSTYPSAATVLRWGCVRSPGWSVRQVDLPLASPADEPDDGPRERLAKRSPVGTALQGRTLHCPLFILNPTVVAVDTNSRPGSSIQQVYLLPCTSRSSLKLRLGVR
jgi:hypothetical protein